MDATVLTRDKAESRRMRETRTDAARADQPHAGEKLINLALQGGGAHGAFSWGVLDRLLEDGRIALEGISATSAGAMNATVAAYGMSADGREGARQALANLWRRVSHAAAFSPLQPTWLDRMMGNRALDLRAHRCPVKLYLSATNVRTGKVKVFGNDGITADAVLASGYLPFLFQAVEIDGESYWDGGYMGNPAMFPLIYNCTSHDVVIVHINPLERPEMPHTAAEVLNRINEISFNSSLMREMRAINFVTDLIEADQVKRNALKKMHIHAISAESEMSRLSVASKLNADRGFLTELRDTSRATAQAWLDMHFDTLGRESTVDIRATYL